MAESSKKCLKIPQRWIMVILGCFALSNEYAMRACLSIALIEMTVPTNHTEVTTDDTCPGNYKSNTTLISNSQSSDVSRYHWSETIQGIILGSFYFGYIFTNLLGGNITRKFGGKHTLGLSVLFTSIFTLVTPVSISWGGPTALIILRFATGFGEGPVYPALNDMLAHWIPEDERAKAGFIVFSGSAMGTIFCMITSGSILQHSKTGWPMIFYIYGGMGLISFLLNAAFCYGKPTENPFISDEELDYLKRKLKNRHSDIPSTPWSHILKSRVVWALVLVNVGQTWGFLTISSDMPKYMSSILKFSVQENGLLMGMPYLALFVYGTIACFIADKVISKKILSITAVRKIGCTIASFGPAVFFVVASYAGCDGIVVIVLLTVGVALMGSCFSSMTINALDLSPNYASSITGLVNSISVAFGMLAPYFVGVLTSNQTISEWRTVFWIICVVLLASDLIYLVYGSGEVQEWNDPSFSNKRSLMVDREQQAEDRLSIDITKN